MRFACYPILTRCLKNPPDGHRPDQEIDAIHEFRFRDAGASEQMVRYEFPDRRSIWRSAPELQSAMTTFVRHAKRDRRGIGTHNFRPKNDEARHLKAEHHVRRRASDLRYRRLGV